MATKSSKGASRGKKIKNLRSKALTSREAKAVKGGFEVKDWGFDPSNTVLIGGGSAGTQKK